LLLSLSNRGRDLSGKFGFSLVERSGDLVAGE
jgi:hypothetical protein